jgi:hypothetical protein
MIKITVLFRNDDWDLVYETVNSLELLTTNGVFVAYWASFEEILTHIQEDLLLLMHYCATCIRNDNIFKKK